MPNWPLISDFSRLLQRPQFAFRDPVLKECTIELDGHGQPKPRSGNFATVYRGYGKDGQSFAVRVFNRRQDERLEHYQAISHYLEQRRVQGVVGFEYDERGIRSASDGKMYPLLTMEWVPGVSLFEWCRDRCREDYREALAIGAEAWLQLVRALRRNEIVHGDLQHGNVLVSREGHFKLVDYDCMGVPQLMGRRNLEIGMTPYQHPGRDAETRVFPGMDNYSALLIYVALKALSVAPWLWIKYVDEPQYDKLLFRLEDFDNPAASPLYNDLMALTDEQVRNLVHYLFELRGYPLTEVPDIDEVLLWCLSLEELLKARDWDTAVALMERMGEDETIPAHLASLAAGARKRVACRKALEEAIRRGDDAQIMRYYVPELLDDYPAAEPLVEQARTAAEAARVIESLATAQRFRKWDVFRAVWNAHHTLLAHRANAKPYKLEMKRLLAADALGKLLADPKSSDEAIVKAWNYLATLGGHPTAEEHKKQVERLVNRHRNLPALQKLAAAAPPEPTMAHDTRLLAAWKEEFNDWDRAEQYREACMAAKSRLRLIERIRGLANHVTLDIEKEIYKLSRSLPGDYHPLMRDRVRQTRHRLRAFQTLQKAISPPRSDLAINEAWQSLKKLAGEGLLTEPILERARLAERRASLVEKLRALPTGLPAAEREQQLLELWDVALLDHCLDADPLRPAYEVARRRQAMLMQLQQAVDESDIALTERLLRDDLLKGFPLAPPLAEGVRQVREAEDKRRLAERQRMIAALMGGRRAAFVREFDHRLLAEICTQFKHHQPVVSQWTEQEVLPLAVLGLRLEADEAPEHNGAVPSGIQWLDDEKCLIRWQWPEERFCGSCRLAICPEEPKPHTHPDDVASFYDTTITRAEWQAHGEQFTLTLEESWAGAQVVVWAVIDLGYQTFFSPPLLVGQLGEASKPEKKRWGIFRV